MHAKLPATATAFPQIRHHPHESTTVGLSVVIVFWFCRVLGNAGAVPAFAGAETRDVDVGADGRDRFSLKLPVADLEKAECVTLNLQQRLNTTGHAIAVRNASVREPEFLALLKREKNAVYSQVQGGNRGHDQSRDEQDDRNERQIARFRRGVVKRHVFLPWHTFLYVPYI